MKRKASKKSAAKPAAKGPAKAKAAAKRSAKAPAKPATSTTSPGPRAAAAPALKAQTAVEAAKYTPAEITGVGWKPFRYPPD